MQSLAALCGAISRTSKKTEKVALVSDFFRRNSIDDSARASVLLSGRAFPAFEETTLNVGGALLSRVLLEVTHATDHQLGVAYRRHGDLGSAAFDLDIARSTYPSCHAGQPASIVLTTQGGVVVDYCSFRTTFKAGK